MCHEAGARPGEGIHERTSAARCGRCQILQGIRAVDAQGNLVTVRVERVPNHLEYVFAKASDLDIVNVI